MLPSPSASRIDHTFTRLRDERRGGMVTYVTAGDPDAHTSAKNSGALARPGGLLEVVCLPKCHSRMGRDSARNRARARRRHDTSRHRMSSGSAALSRTRSCVHLF